MPCADWTEDVAAFYRAPGVKRCIARYCGGSAEAPESFTSCGVAAFGGRDRLAEADGAPVARENARWPDILTQGADVCRALADRAGTLLQLDVDYVDPLDPAAPYRRPAETFARLEPVFATVRALLARYDAPNRALMTGRGYHFTFRAPFKGRFQAGLVEVAKVSDSLAARCDDNARSERSARETIWGHEGAGRLLEDLAHRVLHALRGRTEVPVTLADVAPADGGAFICLDLTAYADPVFGRYARCAFSANQRSAMIQAAPERPFVIVLPRDDQPVSQLLGSREAPARAAELAREGDVSIPDVLDGGDWIEDYRTGPVGRFHAAFDRGPQAEPGAWPFTYDTIDPHDWPPCLAVPLRHPNPALLRPANIRTVALGLWAMGWHPRSIAGLIRSKYERDFGWRTLWQRYDATARAEFYVRLFCGAVADGLDGPADLTCETQAGRGLCGPRLCRNDQMRLFRWLGGQLLPKADVPPGRRDG